MIDQHPSPPSANPERGNAEPGLLPSHAQAAVPDPVPEKPHFSSDYRRLVQNLIAAHPIDQAMESAVGGSYKEAGENLALLLTRCGLGEGMSVVDLGCGSGRVAHALSNRFKHLRYLGIDVVPELLDYARTKCPPEYRFLLNETLDIPADDGSANVFYAFSVFTHLLHEESYLYLQEAKRVVCKNGLIVFSILESERNWPIFAAMVEQSAVKVRKDHLNMFIERPQVLAWARHLELDVMSFDLGGEHSGQGQTVVLLRKP